MRAETQELINDIKKSLKLLEERKNIKASINRLEELESITTDINFWTDAKNAKVLMKERQEIEELINNYNDYKERLKDRTNINSFFQYDKPTIMDHSHFVIQLQEKIKQVYNNILPFANSTISDDLSNRYMIFGMDFIPDSNNNLYFLELNSLPGWNIKFGISNYLY